MGTLSEAAQVFDCPSCGETINTSMTQCPYCSAAIDHTAALAAAVLTGKISNACSDASYVRIVAGSLLAFFLIALVPFLGGLGRFGYYVLLVLVPFLAIRWWVRYGRLVTQDPDFRRAKRDVRIALGIWAAFLVFTAISLALVLR
ncbi:MAG: hypothetical protein WCA44_14960 [Acidobacteriaceae bacterium]|jgi:hypothetical protein